MQRDTHILKIVNIGKTFRKDVGIRCYPEQTYGISQQSPDLMKNAHSLTAKNGYIYRCDEQHPSALNAEDQSNHNIETFYAKSAFSQRRYCDVVGDCIDEVVDFKNVYNQSIGNDTESFKRKKGRLSQFMDRNGWMNKTYKMMGFERSDAARQTSNKIRQQKIDSLPKRNKFQNSVALKPSPKQSRRSPFIFSEKAKIRTQRFSFRQKNNATLDIQRSISPPIDKYLEAEVVTNKLGWTMQDKQWRSTMSTIRKKSNQKTNTLGLTFSDWKDNYQKPQQYKQQVEKDHLQSWFNTTCNSNANPWKYRKPRKVDTHSSQEYNEND